LSIKSYFIYLKIFINLKMNIIKIFRIDQPLRFRIKKFIISVGMQKINFVYAHFMFLILLFQNYAIALPLPNNGI